MSERYEYLLKCIVVGDGGVGKTALSVRYTEGKFRDDYKMTIGVDFSIKKMKINGNNIKIQIWDTGGQEQFSYVRPLYYKGSLGGLVVFDKTNRQSFENIDKWFKEVYDNRGKIPLILVGNKVDLPDIQISTEEAMALAEKYNTLYFDSSAKSGESVNQIFENLVQMILDPNYKNNVAAAQKEYQQVPTAADEAQQKYNKFSNEATAYFQAGNTQETLESLKNALYWAKKAGFDEGIKWCDDQIAYVTNLMEKEAPASVEGIILTCPQCKTYFKVNKDGAYACPTCSSILEKL